MKLLGLSLAAGLAAASPVLHTGTVHHNAAPVLSSMNAEHIADSYIVVFKDHVSHSNAKAHHSWVNDLHATNMDLKKRSQLPFMGSYFDGLKHTYDIAGSIKGYSGHFDEDVLEEIRRHPDVDYIERDSEVHVLKDKDADEPEIEKNAPWGLARISHRDGLSFGSFNKYIYAADGGEGVDVYVIDTGTNIEHVDFEGRAEWEATIPAGDADEDGNGHGTHCSGTVAGKKYGVAKKANVRAIKVLRSNGSGTMSDVVKGVEQAVKAHLREKQKAKDGKRKGFKGSAANMSLGGGKSPTLDRAVNAAVENGIHFAVAAGNDNADSCNYSPAAAEKAVTVGASTIQDERAYFSNFGKCNDIFAPGLNIQSTWIGSKYAVNTISGTSMASPHIAGLLAYMLSLQPASDSAYAVAELTPKKLKGAILSFATKNALSDVPGSTTNLLAFNGAGKSNFSEIVADGGYTVRNSASKSYEFSLPSTEEIDEEVDLLEELIEDEYREAIAELRALRAKVSHKTSKIPSDFFESVEEEFGRWD